MTQAAKRIIAKDPAEKLARNSLFDQATTVFGFFGFATHPSGSPCC